MVARIVNSPLFEAEAPNERQPSRALRQELGSPGARRGVCGALLVVPSARSLDFAFDDLEASCVTAAEERLGPDGTLSIAQEAWLREQALQGGFRQRAPSPRGPHQATTRSIGERRARSVLAA